jgi:UDP-2,3-diacylglucosamine pyrophosphatase LpxH
MKRAKRKIDLVVVSDVHLGTYGSQAKELYAYLRSIKPKTLILNGDIIDFWQFSKRYWPKSHMKVIKSIISMAAKGTRVCYITGNHDEILRKFSGIRMGNIEIVNKLEMNLNGTKTWFFHGDVFDVIIQHSKWLARLGAIGYDSLVLVNIVANYISRLFGRGKISLSKKIKENVKTAVNYIGSFEQTAASLAVQKGFSSIVCGHIHHPEMKEIHVPKNGRILYLNAGDWVENLSALEYHKGTWRIYRFNEDASWKNSPEDNDDPDLKMVELESKEIYKMLCDEFQQG